jgi:hypothetical protein
MHGVPEGLDLGPLIGSRIINVGVGLYNTEFVFEIKALDYGGVNAEGRWELQTAEGDVLGARERGSQDLRGVSFVDVLGATIVSSSLSPPGHFDLDLSTGVRLRFFDDSEEYESMTIHPGDYII